MRRDNLFQTIWKRLQEPRRFLQVLAGPRQVGMGTFARQFTPRRCLLVGAGGIPLEEFLSQPAAAWLA
jgi:hypothetical protein